MNHPIINVLRAQKQGLNIGIYSCCSSNEYVLKAALLRGKKNNEYVLIESTANQVDQYGGYTGMTPKDFYEFIQRLIKETGINPELVILGGDHLGPLTFSHYDEEKAMNEAEELIKQYVVAGFTKIHIDTSMKVASDSPDIRLPDMTIVKRGARLVKVAEAAYKNLCLENPEAIHPVYIVGSEVPIPGGAQEITEMQITKPDDFLNTVALYEKVFKEENLNEAWKYVCGVVVQPGVEEKDAGCTEYDRSKAERLMAEIKKYPNLMFEGHSTDYQTKYKLQEMVEDGVGILKVGPALTFALREAMFGLAFAEKEYYKRIPEKQSYFMETLERKMGENPKYWQKHYHGQYWEIDLKKKYSFSDRCRYYMPDPDVQGALNKLLFNFQQGVPLNLLSQFLPKQYVKIREGKLDNNPEMILIDNVCEVINNYCFATKQGELTNGSVTERSN